MAHLFAAPPPAPTIFQVSIDYPVRCVHVRGELDLATTPLMADSAAILQSAEPADLTLDLLAVTFIDAGALGALVRIGELQRAQGATLHILGSARVAYVAALAGLASIITEQPGPTISSLMCA
jgi:anti-anti-sigma factor